MTHSLYTRVVSGLVFPIQETLKHHTTVAARKQLEASQWWSRDQLTAYQIERLKALLMSANTNVPYYRELFASLEFSPTQVRSLEDVRVLPFLTKAVVRQNLERLRSATAGKLQRSNTGGSSGEPMIFFLGNERVSHDVAAKWRATRWWDVDIGDPEIVLWGSPIELGAQDHARSIRDSVFRTKMLPAFEMSEPKMMEFIETIAQTKPKMLFGYPSAISKIADVARSRNRRMDNLGIEVAFVTAEKLYDEQRRNISTVFGCKVANGYGGRDAGFVAHECPHGGMHITAEDILVELLDSAGNPVPMGSPGEIVVTHFASQEFPFIRYRTGDIGMFDAQPCACGRGLPLLKEIQGRSTDFVVAANGTVLHGLALIYVLRDLPGVRQFKILQESLEHTKVLLVQEAGFPQEGEAKIVSEFRKRLGDGVNISIEKVDHIPPERSGKYRYVVSKVAA